MKSYENHYLKQGYTNIAGIDEAGRGPIAGPVVAAAVILNIDYDYTYINDSKKLSEKQLKLAYDDIMQNAKVGVAIVDNYRIDEINILEATKESMIKAAYNLSVQPDILLIDAVKLKVAIKSESIIKGDQKSLSIAAASIIAKVTRDDIMRKYDLKYPIYNFAKHKGYPTKQHKELVLTHGPCDIHRMSFAPLKYLNK